MILIAPANASMATESATAAGTDCSAGIVDTRYRTPPSVLTATAIASNVRVTLLIDSETFMMIAKVPIMIPIARVALRSFS